MIYLHLIATVAASLSACATKRSSSLLGNMKSCATVHLSSDVVADRQNNNSAGNSQRNCSEHLEAVGLIGPEGGEVVLSPVRLIIPKGALGKETRILLRRYPGDPNRPAECSHLDRYTAYPFLLKSYGRRTFSLRWIWSISSIMPAADEEVICQKVSWTDDGERVACYSFAGLGNIYSIEEPNGSGKYIGIMDGGIGCKWIGRKMAGDKYEFLFITDRLSHFRLLPPSEDWHSRNDLNKDGELKVGFESGNIDRRASCQYILDVEERFITVTEDGFMSSKPSCDSNDDCGGLEFCERRIGKCEEIGFCLPWIGRCSYIESDPVCGCDGNTYVSACEAYRAKINLRAIGPCIR